MRHKKSNKQSDKSTLKSITQEMAKPRMARSAKIAELAQDTTRAREKPTVTLPGKVEKIVPSKRSSGPEKAQIGIDGPDRAYRDLRIENTLSDEHGDDVSLKKGDRVEVTIKAEPEE